MALRQHSMDGNSQTLRYDEFNDFNYLHDLEVLAHIVLLGLSHTPLIWQQVALDDSLQSLQQESTVKVSIAACGRKLRSDSDRQP